MGNVTSVITPIPVFNHNLNLKVGIKIGFQMQDPQNSIGSFKMKIGTKNLYFKRLKPSRIFFLFLSIFLLTFSLLITSSLNAYCQSNSKTNFQGKSGKEKLVKQYVIKKNNKPLPIIIIDSGHGGKDPGAIGKYTRTKEKNITLSYAKELKKKLDATKKFKVFLTRGKDHFIPLKQRVEIARKTKADLFISIHANSSPTSKTSGFCVYTLSETSSDKNSELLAQKENKSDIIGGADFSNASDDILKTLINLSQRNTMNESAKFAEIITRSMKSSHIKTLQKTHRFAGFMVLTAPDVPSVLIELGYLSNKNEERNLNSSLHKNHIIQTLVSSIENYFNQK